MQGRGGLVSFGLAVAGDRGNSSFFQNGDGSRGGIGLCVVVVVWGAFF